MVELERSTIYVIVHRTQAEDTTHFAFTSRDHADELCKSLNKEVGDTLSTSFFVEEVELNPEHSAAIGDLRSRYAAEMRASELSD